MRSEINQFVNTVLPNRTENKTEAHRYNKILENQNPESFNQSNEKEAVDYNNRRSKSIAKRINF